MPRAAACPLSAAAFSPSLKGCSCSTIPDARRERRSARRASRAGGASPLAASRPPAPRIRLHRSKRAICPGSSRRATSSTAAASSPAARLQSAFDARMYAAARVAAAARTPEKDEALAVLERLLERLERRAVFPRRKILQRGRRGRGELEQELLHRSMPPQAAGGHFN